MTERNNDYNTLQVDRADLRIVESRLYEAIDQMSNKCSKNNEKNILKNKQLELQINNLENNLNKIKSEKNIRQTVRTVSTKRNPRHESFGTSRKNKNYPYQSHSIKSRLVKELKKSKKQAKAKKLKNSKQKNEMRTTYSHEDYVESESQDEREK